MSDNFIDQGNGGEQSFADLLDSYSKGMNENIQVGDRIQGEVISIGEDSVYIDTGTKIDGVIDRVELLNEDGGLSCEIGDTLELYVVSFNGNEIRLSKALAGIGSLRILEEAFQSAVPVEGKVKSQIKGGFQVEMSQRRAFCPVSQMDLKYVEDPDEYVGNTYRFLITRFEEGGRNIVVSRRELLDKEQRKERDEFIREVRIGDQLQGRVSKVMPYGAFIELFPGVEGMAHVSELSWSRVEKPDDVLKVDDSVEVKVLNILTPEKGGAPRISLSLKQITGDPWDKVSETFSEGEKVKGTVKRCAGFGAFVEIAPGIEGLVHISEMSYLKRVVRPEDVVQVGQTLHVMIKQIDRENRRISLSIKDAEGDPWIDIEEKYKVGQAVQGILDKRENFGYFVTLEPGITGLLPHSKLKGAGGPSSLERLKPGEPIKVVIAEIHVHEHKITLGPGELKEEEDWKQFADKKKSPFGSLGEKLQQAMKSRKDVSD
ncbi:MAG: 30S ribosomal protein S1 [Desulfatiglandales bacterium]